MTDPITTTLITEAWKWALWVLNENQKWLLNYFLVNFFSSMYKSYLKKNILIRKEAEFEANQEFENKIQNIDTNIYPVLIALQNDSEIEYKNMFWVLEKSLKKVSEKPEWNIDTDKIKRLKDLSKEFSSDDMQDIISWILAWEYNQSWSFSLKTMDIVRSLSRDEINLFRKFCWLVIDWNFIFWWFFNLGNKNHLKLHKKWILYSDYLYLQELGLFTWSNTSQKIWDTSWDVHNYSFSVANKEVILQLKKEITLNNQSNLTKAWKELYRLIEPIFDEELFNMCKEELINQWFEKINIA